MECKWNGYIARPNLKKNKSKINFQNIAFLRLRARACIDLLNLSHTTSRTLFRGSKVGLQRSRYMF